MLKVAKWLLVLLALTILPLSVLAGVPGVLDPSKPLDVDPISQGASQIRAFKQLFADTLGLPTAPTSATRIVATGQGRLTFTNSTTVSLCPFNGNNLTINGTTQTISSGCVTLGTGGLAASTTYFIYAFMNGSSISLEASTTTHATDTTYGYEIKSGDGTRSLVGMVRTNGSTQFENDNALRGVISFYNRRSIGLVNNFTAARTTASTTFVELNTEIRGNFLTWADEAASTAASGAASNNTANQACVTALAYDGGTAENVSSYLVSPTANFRYPIALAQTKGGLSEGFHFVTLYGLVSANTGSWDGGTAGSASIAPVTLTALIRG